MKKLEHFCTVRGNVKWYSHYRNQYIGSSNKQTNTKKDLSRDVVIQVLSIYPWELKTGSQRDICAFLFTVALSKIGSNPNALGWYNPNQWMRKQNVAYIHSGILFSLLKEGNSDTCNNTGKPGGHYKWNKLVTKINTARFHFYKVSRVVKLIKTESGMRGIRGLREDE